jgi:hypothetical protein
MLLKKISNYLFFIKCLDFNVSKENVTQKIMELLVNRETEIIQLNHNVYDILVLRKNRLVCSSRYSNCLALYDDDLNLIKIVEKINEVGFDPAGIASYDDYLYINAFISYTYIYI